MARYAVRRLVSMCLVVVGVTSVVFVITRLLPADPVGWAAGPQAGPEQVARLRSMMRLDRPLWEQYVTYLAGLGRGDLGFSMYTLQPVAQDLRTFFPATAELALYAMGLTVILSTVLGVTAALSWRHLSDTIISLLSTVGAAIPVFWLGLMFQVVLYGQLGWFPPGERLSPDMASPVSLTGLLTVDAVLRGRADVLVNALYHLILPALTLALQRTAVVTRMVRSSMLEVLRQDYIRTARAKGLSGRRVLYVHALRNASLSVLTLLGLQFGWLLGGTVLVEAIFQWPGIGLYAVRAISQLDYSVVAGVTLLVSVLFVLINFGVDLFYAILDPRIRY